MKKRTFLSVVYLLITTIMLSSCNVKNKIEKPTLESPIQEKVTAPEKDTWSIFIYLCGTDLESGGLDSSIDEYYDDPEFDADSHLDNSQAYESEIFDNADLEENDYFYNNYDYEDDYYEPVEGNATQNLQELFDVSYSDKVNIYVQTGGTSKWFTEDINPDKIQRFHIKNGGMTLLEEHELTSMGDPKTLESFLQWGVDNHSADKMGVIMWNHGGGSISGIAFDERFEYDGLTLSELKQAFAKVGHKYEFVGFDACLMATLETAHVLTPYANYLIASEELEPVGGWDYTTWAQHLSDNPSISGSELGTVICDSYYKKCMDNDDESEVTLSVIDLNKLKPVVKAFDQISVDLDKNVNDISFYSKISRGISRTESYGANSPMEGYTNHVDLGDFIYNIQDAIGEKLTIDLLKTLDKAVLYSINGPGRQNATGLSLFYPISLDEDQEEEYRSAGSIFPSRAYKFFIDTTLENKESFIDSEEEHIRLLSKPYFTDNGTYTMNIDPNSLDYIDHVSFSLFIKGDDGDIISLGSDSNLFMDWETGEISDNFSGNWLTLNDYYVSSYVLENTLDHILYSIPILLNGVETSLRAMWVWDEPNSDNHEGHYEILGAWGGIDSETGIIQRGLTPIKKGDVIIPLFFMENNEDNNSNEDEPLYHEGGEIVVNNSLILKEQTLFAGDYHYAFEIIDVYGNSTIFDQAVITIDENGDMWVD